MIYDEHVLFSGSLISSNHGWLCRQEYAYGTGLQLKNLKLALKQASLSTSTAHVLLQLTAGGRTVLSETTHVPRETTLEACTWMPLYYA